MECLLIAPVLIPAWPLLLLPVHIALLELIIDPSCSLIFESEPPEANIMRRPPRSPTERVFWRRSVSIAALQGMSILAVCLVIVYVALPGHGTEAARALSFACLVVAFVTVILVNRSWTHSILTLLRVPNPAVWCVVGGTAVFLTSIMTIPALQRLFSFAPLEVLKAFWPRVAHS